VAGVAALRSSPRTPQRGRLLRYFVEFGAFVHPQVREHHFGCRFREPEFLRLILRVGVRSIFAVLLAAKQHFSLPIEITQQHLVVELVFERIPWLKEVVDVVDVATVWHAYLPKQLCLPVDCIPDLR
jgi:hypothetical protein